MNEIYKNIVKLSSGTAIAQIIPLLAYPVLTRIFAPEDFGTFATIILFSSLLGVFASGCYEHAIIITKSKTESANLIALTMFRSCLVLSLSLPIIYFSKIWLAKIFNDPSLVNTLYFVPFIALCGIIFAIHSEWLVKYKQYNILSRNRILQGSFLVASKIAIGINFTFIGILVIGELLGRFFSAILSLLTIIRSDTKFFKRISFKELKRIRSRFTEFPKVMIHDQLINILAGSIHVLFIGAAFGPEQLGYVALLFSALYLPVTIISSSIKDVFRQKAVFDYNESGSCRPLYLKLFKVIAIFGLPVFTFGFFVSPELFPIILGDNWRPVGAYAQIMMPMYYINFVCMSLGGVLIFTEKIKMSFYWQILSVLLNIIALYIGCYVVEDIVLCLVYLALSRSFTYVCYILMSYYYALDHSKLITIK